ncbi:MAG: bifunctional UDP-N-acetylglucosamine diphosphorylase/glucosamine-1-phosphate N-acetyltransferase GlmU [Chloroflexota bacterium]|nr:bifunctional UDP-N-acetylglucosamine diphosphorylase/glucosamine-1-phosphate N-acetyltransferase GlmU [Chloroflexota bacterium]
MRSRLPKVLHTLGGRPMLAYVVDAAREATGGRPLVVYSPATAQIRDAFSDQADLALQDEPRGTGDAVRAALEAIPAGTEEIVVLNGDLPFVTSGLISELLAARREAAAVMALVWTESEPRQYGRVVLDGAGDVDRIVEYKDATDEERAIRSWNAGLYVFDVAWLRGSLGRLSASGTTGEVYLTGLVEVARSDQHPVIGVEGRDPTLLEGLDDRTQFPQAERDLQDRILRGHMSAGVTIRDDRSAFIDATVEIAEDVTLEPDVTLKGTTRIGRDTIIKSGSYVVDSVIGERCTIWASVIEDAVVEDDVRVGPFSHLRPGAHIGRGSEIGNFAEVKKASLGPGTRQHHFSYIGDAQVGARVNIGAGTITANYDGRGKHHTRIGDDAFIGSDTILRAPVEIGEGAVTGAGSVVTRDVPPGKLAVGMPARIRERRLPADPPEGPG